LFAPKNSSRLHYDFGRNKKFLAILLASSCDKGLEGSQDPDHVIETREYYSSLIATWHSTGSK
jgi:hypothetical protein